MILFVVLESANGFPVRIEAEMRATPASPPVNAMSIIVKPAGWSIPEGRSVRTLDAERFGVSERTACRLLTQMSAASDAIVTHGIAHVEAVIGGMRARIGKPGGLRRPRQDVACTAAPASLLCALPVPDVTGDERYLVPPLRLAAEKLIAFPAAHPAPAIERLRLLYTHLAATRQMEAV